MASSEPPLSTPEIEPPWVVYPGYPPGDGFWRQSGELWLNDVWRPYWDALDAAAKDSYLRRWKVPQEWRDFYFDPDFVEWMEGVDDD